VTISDPDDPVVADAYALYRAAREVHRRLLAATY
jgi:hypothetical protein